MAPITKGAFLRLWQGNVLTMKIAVIGQDPLAHQVAKRVEEEGGHAMIFRPQELSNVKSQGAFKRLFKTFLTTSDALASHQRMKDLFRVIYQRDFGQEIDEQLQTGPELFKQITPQMLEELKQGCEFAEDFDAVIDTRPLAFGECLGLGPGGVVALNEPELTQHRALIKEPFWENVLQSIQEKRTLLFLLNDFQQVDWVEDYLNEYLLKWQKVYLVSREQTWSKLKKLEQKVEDLYQEDLKHYQQKQTQWEELETFEKAKISRPLPPERKLEIFYGHEVMSIDHINGRPELFLTIERPEFRGHENLKTLAADWIVPLNGQKYLQDIFLSQSEVGYYRFRERSQSVDAQLDLIINHIKGFFKQI